jgi:hypothetical protein
MDRAFSFLAALSAVQADIFFRPDRILDIVLSSSVVFLRLADDQRPADVHRDFVDDEHMARPARLRQSLHATLLNVKFVPQTEAVADPFAGAEIHGHAVVRMPVRIGDEVHHVLVGAGVTRRIRDRRVVRAADGDRVVRPGAPSRSSSECSTPGSARSP